MKQRELLNGSAFHRLGEFAARRKWAVIALWVVGVVALGPQLSKLQGRLSQGGFEVAGSQSDQVKQAVQTEFKGQYQFRDLLVLHSPTAIASGPEFQSVVEKESRALAAAPGVGSVTDPYSAPQLWISSDGHTVLLLVGLTDGEDDALKHAATLDAAARRAAEGSGITPLLTGAAPFYSAFTDTTTRDLTKAERVALPISMVILLVAFGSVVAAGMPVVLALLSLAVAFGLISILASQATVSIFTQNVSSMIGIGVGIDYSLFILTRFREQLKTGEGVAGAIAGTMATSGKAVFASALTVVVALSGTLLVNLQAIRSMGLGAMIAVTVAGAAALTLLPALLSVVGEGVNRLSIARRRREGAGLWHRWAMMIMKRPLIPLFASLLFLGVLAAPARHLRIGSSGPSILPADATPRKASELIAGAFGKGQVGPAQILVRDPSGVTGAGFDGLYRFTHAIAKYPEVARVDSIATVLPGATVQGARAVLQIPKVKELAAPFVSTDGQATLVAVVTRHDPQSKEAGDLVVRLRAEAPKLLAAPATAIVGGDPALNTDINHEVQRRLPSVVALVLALSFFVLLLFLRSVLLPLKALVMNMASVLAAYGLLVFVFQEGRGERLLSFASTGNIESFLPLFLFCILFGLSMDYEVFLLARIKEEYQRTGDNAEAVGWGLEHTARIITSAAAVMVTVFGAFAFASLVPIKAMGFGLAVAVFLDATVIRIILVPATMRLMGKWNWWMPAWLDRLLPHISLEAGPAPAPAPAID